MSTYTPIASQTLGSAASSVTFSSLPQNYTDLRVVVNAAGTLTGYDPYIRFNGDTTTNYSITALYGTGSSAGSVRYSNQAQIRASSQAAMTTTINTNHIFDVFNYANTATYKTVLIRANAAGTGVDAIVGLWRKTPEAINQIDIFVSGTTFIAGSTFTIYGVAAGNSSAKASGGNIVTTDGTYWYHAFTSSGTFIPSTALSADVLVVAGGGGGGTGVAGGGGAGGLLAFTSQSLSSNTVYQAIIGAGGAGSATSTGVNGGNSKFGSLTTTIGGGGSNYPTPQDGGSGAGAHGGDTTAHAGGSPTSGQGYAGGSTSANSGNGAGGGGGAGAAGESKSGGNAGGAGGNGLNTWSSWASATGTGASGYYAGGGGGAGRFTSSGGGAGGLGGGGNGEAASNLSQTSGLPNTGGGGGGGSNTGNAGKSGGSGIIIVRYAV